MSAEKSLELVTKNSEHSEEADSVPHVICAGVCCVGVGLLTVLIVSLVDDSIMHLGLSYDALIALSLVSIIISIIWNYTLSYNHHCLSCDVGCEKVPSWAIFFLLESTFLLLLCMIGVASRVNNNVIEKEYEDYLSNYDEISYPLGVLITFGVLGIISLIIGILGIYDCTHDPQKACVFVFFNLVTFFLLILDIITDVITAVKIYSYKDAKFFWTSLAFTS